MARGFTLIEVLIVIAILLAIGGLVVVNLLPKKDQADVDLQKVQFKQVEQALSMFKMDMKRYPTEDEGLAALNSKSGLTDEADAANWKGPYMEGAVPKDKWNQPLVYHYPGELNGEAMYDLISAGPDKEEGTEDDITNKREGAGDIGEDEGFEAPPEPPAGG